MYQGLWLYLDYPYVYQPVAISQFPLDLGYRTVSSNSICGWAEFDPQITRCWPLDWARRHGNVVVRNVHDYGGHFAAVETPDLILDDIRKLWGNASLSNLGALSS